MYWDSALLDNGLNTSKLLNAYIYLVIIDFLISFPYKKGTDRIERKSLRILGCKASVVGDKMPILDHFWPK